MSGRILTHEQLAGLAALQTTQGPMCVAGMGDSIRLEAPVDFSKPWTVAVMPPRGWLAPGDPTLLAAAPDLLATSLDRDLRILDLERRLNLRESALSDAGADLHALTEEARELGTDAHPDDLRAFVSRLVDVYAGAAGRAVVEERDALRAEVAKLRAALASQQVAQAVTLGALAVQEQVRARAVPSYHAPIARHVVDPERIRAAVIEAIEAVHVAPPPWVGSVADDVLARLQASEIRREWVVQLEPGVWLAPWKGDPGRTCERSSARRFGSERAALRALECARELRSFLAAVVEVA